jgi:hypothetical protein
LGRRKIEKDIEWELFGKFIADTSSNIFIATALPE